MAAREALKRRRARNGRACAFARLRAAVVRVRRAVRRAIKMGLSLLIQQWKKMSGSHPQCRPPLARLRGLRNGQRPEMGQRWLPDLPCALVPWRPLLGMWRAQTDTGPKSSATQVVRGSLGF